MTHQSLSTELKRIADLVEKHENLGWAALDRDHALAQMRHVYARLLEIELTETVSVELPQPKAVPLAPQPAPAAQPEVKPALTEVPLPENTVIPEAKEAFEVSPRPNAVEAPKVETAPEPGHQPKVEQQPEPPVVAEVKVVPPPTAQRVPNVAAPIAKAEPQPSPILADKLQKPISDLRTGIPLNEKFGLIKNLFDNNSTEYQDAILHLGRCANRAELLYHFDEISRQRKWNIEEAQYLQFREYIERRAIYLDLTTPAV